MQVGFLIRYLENNQYLKINFIEVAQRSDLYFQCITFPFIRLDLL
jgi:hypothetical protein